MVQYSSYDRGTRIVDADTVNWWANADLGNYLRKEKTSRGLEWVMAEAEGSGAIIRLWSANPEGFVYGRRVWRIYLDGSEEPVIEARGKDLLHGKVEPWGPAYAGLRGMGSNFIFPILFSKSAKVTVQRKTGARDQKPMMYYQVNMRLFPEGTRVKSFSWEEMEKLREKIDQAAAVIEDPDSAGEPEGERAEVEVELAPGSEGELFHLDGPAQVSMFRVDVIANEKSLDQALGKTLLLMSWDGMPEASVRTPLGDFFGGSPGAVVMRSLPASMEPTREGARLVSRWVMPFREKAVISLENRSGERLKVRATVIISPRSWTDDSLYFHADYRESLDIKTRPYTDMRMVDVKGRGHFVGLQMNVRNPMEYFWWGEGDEKVWVDDDQFPSVFGTGTEDYFGYAWCFQYIRFVHAFHGVSVPTREWLIVPQIILPVPFLWEAMSNATAKQAVVSQYRWQIIDAIPFEKNFRFDMEILHHRETTVDVNATAYWYAAPGSEDDAKEPDLGARVVWKP
jgi:hypothetical protein